MMRQLTAMQSNLIKQFIATQKQMVKVQKIILANLHFKQGSSRNFAASIAVEKGIMLEIALSQKKNRETRFRSANAHLA